MTEKIVFYLVSLIAVISSLYIIFSKDIFRSFISMFIVFLATGIIYFIMGLEFLGIFQLIIYTGAMMVIFLVAINTIPEIKKIRKTNVFSLIFAVFVSVIFISVLWHSLKKALSQFQLNKNISISFIDVAKTLFNYYPIQIEIISMILLVAVVISYSLLKGDENEL